jgi:seryl-tRNA synthetase
MLQLPNLPHASVKIGQSAEDNLEMRAWGDKAEFDFKPKTHVELCESLNWWISRAPPKFPAADFFFTPNWGARLERALIQFLLELHTGEHGYTEVSPPFLVNAIACGAWASFPNSPTSITPCRRGTTPATLGKLFLIPTAETPVANIHRDEILKDKPVADSLLRLHAVLSRRGGRGGGRHARHDSRPSI